MNLSKHKFEELELDMTPMIDVVFLLIIFFMLITDMTQQDLEVLTLPKATTAEPDEPDPKDFRPVINITQTGDMIVKRDKIFSGKDGGGDEDETDLKKKLFDYSKLMEQEHFDKEAGTGPMIPGEFLLIRADQFTLFHYVQRVMTLCGDKDIQIWKVQLAAATEEAGAKE
ncbi:MAG: biopolymer transporter ExbD [Planctomycetota bacterium]|nr:biopolymer transporter ExbD [Planctomycetota bacterium]